MKSWSSSTRRGHVKSPFTISLRSASPNIDRHANILYPGSRLLIVAHIRLPPVIPTPVHLRGHVRQSSDDLIQDLEYHLGATNTEYLLIRITYRHSGFPRQGAPPDGTARGATAAPDKPADGTISLQTRMETTACAVIKRHNTTSPWSLRPVPQPGPPLFNIVASHWGLDSAREVTTRVGNQGRAANPPRRLTNLSPSLSLRTSLPGPSVPGRNSDETLRPTPAPPPTRAAPPIPRRQTSLQRNLILPSHTAQGAESAYSSAVEEYDSEADPARKIWTAMSSKLTGGKDGTRPSHRMSRVREGPRSAAPIPVHMSASAPRRVAVDIGRLSPDLCTADTDKWLARSSEERIGQEKAHGWNSQARAEPAGKRRLRVEGQTQSLRGRASMSNMAAGDRGAGNTSGTRRTGESEIGAASAGFAMGFGLSSSARPMAEAPSIGRSGYQGSRVDKEKEKARESGKWGWSGWWQ